MKQRGLNGKEANVSKMKADGRGEQGGKGKNRGREYKCVNVRTFMRKNVMLVSRSTVDLRS